MKHKRLLAQTIGLMLVLPWLVACGGGGRFQPETVFVTFEIQAIGGGATYTFGVVGGQGSSGSTGGPGVVEDTFSAQVGDQVFARAAGFVRPGESEHQVICRIIVRDEEIYVHGDQGYPGDEAEVECAGPVYIPDEEDE